MAAGGNPSAQAGVPPVPLRCGPCPLPEVGPMLRTLSNHRAAVGALLVLLLVAACGGSAGAILSRVGAAVPEPAAGSTGSSTAASAAPAQPFGDTSGSGGGQDPNNAAFRDDAKIVRTGTLGLQVDDLASAVRAARDAIRGLNGYVAGSRQTNDGENSVAEVTYRIPSDRRDQGLDALRN